MSPQNTDESDNKDFAELEKLGFTRPDESDSYDEVDSEEGQAELPMDSFDESAASEDEEGCGCVR